MNTLRVLVLLIYCSLISGLYADVGDSIEQAKSRYGNPSGTLKNGTTTIHIYETDFGKITEAYDANLICIESDASQMRAAVEVVPEEINVLQAESSNEQSISAKAPASPPSVKMDGPRKEQKTAFSEYPLMKYLKKKLPPLYATILILSLMCGMFALILHAERQEAQSGANGQSQDEAALSDTMDKKN